MYIPNLSDSSPLKPDYLRQLDQWSFTGVMWSVTVSSLLFLTLPTVIVLITSFGAGETLRFPPSDLSLKWYISLLDLPEIHETALTSLKLAFLTTVICVVLGVCAALALASSQTGWVQAMDTLVMSPLALPGLAVGLGILIFFNLIGYGINFNVLLISHVVICVPFIVRTTLASLSQLSSSLKDASTSLGATQIYTFFHVTLPLIQRGVITGAFITFLSSFDNLTVSLFLSDARNQVLPIQMWSMIENNLDIRVAAIAGIVVILTAVLMTAMEQASGLSQFFMSRR
ncbi:ABC transporter permease [Leptolyngbya sp. NK1-12]|uniref:ABC transporter permease n=1 Tax=Leptolyngbya sp. NK1-12 TaxID=2547451 RepID=A0AA96WEZ0_9CYAN|nr:ABC transporter permease [Leptolyngbya sp. NK1-12]WNZ24128.1 ABC transporter permease [Leptolyngbya sp. NK1-12]